MKEQDLHVLMSEMSLGERIGQLVQLDGGCFGADELSTGPRTKLGVTQADVDVCGSVLNVIGADRVHAIQDAYLKRSRLKIPLLFMDDVIYGYQTCYPVPLGLGATWDPDLVRSDYELIAEEASADGCMVAFSPPVDIARDARWGRCLEMPGEDPLLTSRLADAMVRGFQGDGTPLCTVASCVKHYAAYGAVEAGREYNTVDMSERRLRQDYLPPYKAAVDAGCKLVMTSFNTIDGVPATANAWLVDEVLRGEWGFEGVTISDYAAVHELVNHGVAKDDEQAALLALNATLDIDMKTSCYAKHLAPLVERGEVSQDQIDAACWRVLVLKNQLGLFEDPYHSCSPERAAEVTCTPDRLASARKTCDEALVLLRNDGVLPLPSSGTTVALLGPYADSKDIVGMWAIHADRSRSKTVREAMEERIGTGQVRYAKGCEILDDVSSLGEFGTYVARGASEGPSDSVELEREALVAASESDVCVVCLGEHMLQSGEAGSRTDLSIPAHQRALLHKLHESGKRTVVVLFNGRPLALEDILPDADAILEAWFPGTAGGTSICDVLFGDFNPSGRLSMTFPYDVGQEPLHYAQYATGRPVGANHVGRFVTGYLDAPNGGLFPFGYGLSYHSATVSDLRLGSRTMTADDPLEVAITVTNEGNVWGTETVQLYVRDLVGSVVRPVLELKDFQKVTLRPGESHEVRFTVTEEALRFWRRDMTYGSEPGDFRVFVGLSSVDLLDAEFSLM